MADRIAECDSCCFSRPAADSFILSVIPKNLWPTSDARSNLLNMAVKLVAFQSEIFSVWNNRPAPSWLDSAIGGALHRQRWGQSSSPVSPKSRKLFDPEKPFLKVQPAYSVKLVFSYVVKGIKIKITAKFRASRRLRFEDTKRLMSSEIRPQSFGTFGKQALSQNFPRYYISWVKKKKPPGSHTSNLVSMFWHPYSKLSTLFGTSGYVKTDLHRQIYFPNSS